jgi:nucleoside-triphosphatase
MAVPPRILIEARPGAGKTTAARRASELLAEAGRPVRGIVTGELREGGRRVGFEIESLGGDRATLAHVDLSGPPRVGRYGVDLAALERVALPALEPSPGTVVIVDELGKMELGSEPFREAVVALLEEPVAFLGTVQAARHVFTDALKRREDVRVVRLTRANRDALPGELVQTMEHFTPL